MAGYNFNNIRINNRYEIIQQIYRETDINRNHITQTMGLTGAAVTKIINSLIKEKYISEQNYHSAQRKRRARYLSINEGAFGGIILYFGRTMVTAAALDICGKILYSRNYALTCSMINEAAFYEIIKDTARIFPKDLTCLGCVCITPGNNSIRDIEKIEKILIHGYHVPVFMENDSNAALLGEKWFGKGKDTGNFVLYSIGKGIGSAICSRGRLLRGYHSNSIQIGHVSIDYQGPVCGCGSRGCLELYTAMDNWEKKLLEGGKYPEEPCKVQAMFSRSREGDPESKELVSQYSRMISEGAVILANMFSPEKIIVTTNEADFICLPPVIQAIKEELQRRSASSGKTNKQEICVEDSELRNTNYILGGIAVILLNQLFIP